MYTIILIASIFVPVLIFTYIGLSKVSATTDINEYYNLSGHAKESDYTQSTIAYMFQTATTFYFIYWGYNYGFANILYILSWLAGIFLFLKFSKPLAELFRNNYTTLPQLVGSSKSPLLVILATIVSVLGFSAIIYVETYYSSMFGEEVIGYRNIDPVVSNSVWWIFFLTFLSVSILYSLLGGIKKVFYTDNMQLGLAYFGFCLVFSFLGYKSFSVAYVDALVVCSLIAIVLAILLLEDIKQQNFGAKFKLLLTGAAIYIFFAIQGAISSGANITGAEYSIPGLLTQLIEPYGWVTLLGFTVINVGWQFCDNSNFQRISAIECEDSVDKQEVEKRIEGAIRTTLFASPLTWSFGIFLGMLIRTAGISISELGMEANSFIIETSVLVGQGEYLALLGLVGFAITISSIMLSTVDSSILSILQLLEVDLLKRKSTSLFLRAIVSSVLFVIVVSFAVLHRTVGEENILVLVNAAYAQLFVLTIPAIMRLVNIKVSTVELVVSIVIGSILTWWASFWAPASIPYNVALVLPTFAALIGVGVPLLYSLIRHEKN